MSRPRLPAPPRPASAAPFPADFAQALRPGVAGWKRRPPLVRAPSRLAWHPACFRPAWARAALRALRRELTPYLVAYRSPIDPDSIARMRHNYSELLPKVMSNRTVVLNRRGAPGLAAARRIGLLDFLGSESLRRIAELASGLPLEPDPGRQVILYEPGDYVGPHNDHHPEDPHLRGGFVDVHVSLCTPGVESQFLVWEVGGHLARIANVGVASGLSISALPFWHYTTPLVARPGQRAPAQRWLLLASYTVDSARRRR